jgi:D-amino peptidase
MKVFIMTDLEGISGIGESKMIEMDHPRHSYALERLMADTNAAVEGAFLGGACEVLVADGHMGGGNFLDRELDSRARQVPVNFWDGMEKDVSLAMAVGAHAMAGTLNAFLDHTMSSQQWFNYSVNGRKNGELGILGILFGHYGIPIVMVSGDEAACAEARQFFGPVETAIVKVARGRNSARLVEENEATKTIRESARRAMALGKAIKPYKPLLPMEIVLELTRTDYCDELAQREDAERLDARTMRKVSNNRLDILFL